MRIADIVFLVIGYGMVGFFIGNMFAAVAEIPEDDRLLAIVFTLGILWPMSIVGAIVYATYRGLRVLARSYAALWSAWPGPRLPAARARTRQR